MIKEIEPRIRPLVDALNATGILETFSSCEGHFGEREQELTDRNRADVRFDPAPGVSEATIEFFLSYLITEFIEESGIHPVSISAHKLYTPYDKEVGPEVDAVYVLELSPFDRFDPPEQVRKDIDAGIASATRVVAAWTAARGTV